MRRDAWSLGLLIFMPMLVLLLYGFALNFDVKNLPIAVLDHDRSAMSRALADEFKTTEYFDFVGYLSSSEEIDRLMAREKIRIALVIPYGYEKMLKRGEPASVQVIIDGSNAASASLAAGYVSSIIQARSARLTIDALASRGLQVSRQDLPAEVRVWYNPELRSIRFLLPGLMAYILMINVVVATAFSVVREKERGTIEQLVISPLKPAELISGKLVPQSLISLLAAHFVLAAGLGIFGVSIRGNYLLLLLFMAIYLLCGLGQGLLISTVAHTQQVAYMISVLSTMLPTLILSGFIFPIREMPVVIQAVTHLVPARYFLVALRGIILKGVGLAAIWPQLLFLLAFAALTLGAGVLRLRKLR